MVIAFLILGLLPLIFLGDMFLGGDDVSSEEDAASDETTTTSSEDSGTVSVFESDPDRSADEEDDTPLQPITGDPAPYAGDAVDPDDVLTPNEDDATPFEGDDVDPNTVLDPIDEPGEDYTEGTGSSLQQLLDEETDLRTGIGFLGDQVSETTDYLLDDDNNLIELADSGDGEGTLSDFDGTPVIDTDGDLAVVDGAAGDDTIAMGDDAGYAFGGDGEDTIFAGSGTQALFGGAGDDLIVGGASDGFADGGDGNDTILGGDGDETLFGGSHDATDDATDDDLIDGGAGDDTIAGGWGSDTLAGGEGDDVIDHHGRVEEEISWERHEFDWHIDGAADTLDGGAGNDTLIMGREDTATGGEGMDTFWVYFDPEGEGFADITDFETGTDFLRISLDPELDHGAMELDVSPSEDGEDAIVSVNGEVVAVLRGAADATASSVLVEATENIYA